MFTWLDFIVMTLAASAIVDVWLNGSLFVDWRAFFQAGIGETQEPEPETVDPETEIPADSESEMPWSMQLADRWLPRWFNMLMSCEFCFSHHTPWIVGVMFFFPATLVPWQWLAFLFKLPAYSLAATRLGTIINSLLPPESKYHR